MLEGGLLGSLPAVSSFVLGIAVCCPTFKLGTACTNGAPGSKSGLVMLRYRDQKLVSMVSCVRFVRRAAVLSATLTKLPRRIAFSVNSRNQRSTRFNQLELVGTKWHTKRGCFFSHACTCGSLCVP